MGGGGGCMQGGLGACRQKNLEVLSCSKTVSGGHPKSWGGGGGGGGGGGASAFCTITWICL